MARGWEENEGKVPTVTVCIPAYRSGGFIDQTLAAVRAQTFSDFTVEIAVEPVDQEATSLACQPFLDDPRFRLHHNDATQGYAGNVRGLLARVETPYFMTLPHDDILHPEYLEVLLGALLARPDASVAYGDLYLFGPESGSRFVRLADGGLGDRLLSFFLEGAEGTPWHGVTRREVLHREFPTSDFAGLAVECEWALHLVREGVALRVARPLFFKRNLRGTNVSWGWRSSMPEARLRQALDDHRRRMLAGIPSEGIVPVHRRAIELAAEAALLRRWVIFSGGRFRMTSEQLERADRVIAESVESGMPAGPDIARVAQLALSRYWRALGDDEESQRLASDVVESARDWDGWLQLARLTLDRGNVYEAVRLLIRASELAPMAVGITQLQAECTRRLEALHPWPGS